MNNKPTILVIEDDPDIQMLVQLALTTEGYDVLQASNGLQALACLEHTTPDLILLDMNMPIMNGWMFLMHYLDSSRDQPPIIATSAQVIDPQNIAGISGFLPKPFDIGRLRSMFAEILGRSASV